jgi:hypothetical protein
MKIAGLNLLAGLFSFSASSRAAASAPAARQASSASSEVQVTAASQPYVLQGKMKERNMTHGETVVATVSPVRLEPSVSGTVIYFCPIRSLDIAETLTLGDGGEIPGNVVVEDFIISGDLAPGLYTLKNVRLTSNGAIQLKATAATEVEIVQ